MIDTNSMIGLKDKIDTMKTIQYFKKIKQKRNNN
jgi:hypothetical protein